jgi:RNA polymerase sigma-70 factor (ECF subfamily)
MTEQESFDAMYQTYYGRIVKYLARTVGPDDADDIAQEVFEKIFTRAGSFENRSSLYTWIYRIATNHLIDKMRKKQKSLPICYLSDKELFSKSNVEYLAEEFRIVQNEMKECICSYIKMLPPNYRIAVILREFEHMPVEDISEVMNLTKENTKKILTRARTKLRTILRTRCRIYYDEKNNLSCENKNQ